MSKASGKRLSVRSKALPKGTEAKLSASSKVASAKISCNNQIYITSISHADYYIVNENVDTVEMDDYRSLLVEEMLKLCASNQELWFIKDATIRNAIRNNRKPENVAWAILQ